MKLAGALDFREDSMLREKVAFLSNPRRIRSQPPTVEVIETHFAWVFLAGDRAYKLKKALRQASMDYRTLASRERVCREELRLNRRLAPGVYMRVLPVRRSGAGSLRTRNGARIVDWLIEMRRLPAARMLDRAIAEGTVGRRDVDRVAQRLAAFFATARRRPMSDEAYLSRLQRQIRRNAHELAAPDLGLSGPRVTELEAIQLEFLARNPSVVANRGSRLIDGHGDLRPEHVFLGASFARDRLLRNACVIDCLEFDADLRRLDPAEEIAFLALECARLGALSLAGELIARYRSVTGDVAPAPLLHFYMSRRAAVRAQIAAWHLRDEAFAGEARKWRAHAHDYLRDALRHIRRAVALSSGANGISRRLAKDPPAAILRISREEGRRSV